ncbi:MAG TPA: hypothetical protein VGK40_07525 [Verrucomicrobiae bacterium]|jgi:hypothetical protein
MRPLRKIAFLLDEFAVPSPAQQILDRFLIGYPRDGAFHKLEGAEISTYLAVSVESNFGQRPEEFHLVVAPTAEQAVAGADAVVIVSRRPGALANEAFLKIALEQAPEGAACFVHGVLANSLASARDFAAAAAKRHMALLAGTPLSVTWRLPPVELPPGTPLAEALIVVQVGPQALQATPPSPPATLGGAELQALEALLPVIERRRGGESGIRSVRFLEGKSFWKAGEKGLWSWPLLASALSRSHTPQGDAVLDGRTQDLVGLGLVPKLARNPRAWLLEHGDGLRSAILVLDGVVADFNFAVRAQNGEVVSAQVFRAPPPAEHHFSRLTAVLEDFFHSGQSPWPVERNLLIAGLLETFGKPSSLTGQRVKTPKLGIAYTLPGTT